MYNEELSYTNNLLPYNILIDTYTNPTKKYLITQANALEQILIKTQFDTNEYEITNTKPIKDYTTKTLNTNGQQLINKETLKKLKRIIEHYKPNTIFTHTITDGHPDHRAVHELTVRAVKETFINTRVLTFDINFFNFQKGLKVHYDITKTFDKKMQALNLIKSQHSIITLLKPLILLKAITYGIRSKNKYAECFTAL